MVAAKRMHALIKNTLCKPDIFLCYPPSLVSPDIQDAVKARDHKGIPHLILQIDDDQFSAFGLCGLLTQNKRPKPCTGHVFYLFHI